MDSVAASDLKIIEHFSQQLAASEYRSKYATYLTHENLRLSADAVQRTNPRI
jgi:hypothetical protein